MDGLRKEGEKRGEREGREKRGRRRGGGREERSGKEEEGGEKGGEEGGKEGGEEGGEGRKREREVEGRRKEEKGGEEGKNEGSWRVWVRCSAYLCTHLERQCVEPFRKLLQFAAADCLTVAIVRKHDISLNVQTCVCTQVALPYCHHTMQWCTHK